MKTPEPVKTADPVKTPEPVKTAAPVKAAPRQLYGTVKITAVDRRTKSRMVVMTSQNPFPLTNCELRLPMNIASRVNDIAPSGQGTLSFAYFRPDARAPFDQFKNDWAAMYCAEGSGFWKTSYEK